jgi:hypothetical protein
MDGDMGFYGWLCGPLNKRIVPPIGQVRGIVVTAFSIPFGSVLISLERVRMHVISDDLSDDRYFSICF